MLSDRLADLEGGRMKSALTFVWYAAMAVVGYILGRAAA